MTAIVIMVLMTASLGLTVCYAYRYFGAVTFIEEALCFNGTDQMLDTRRQYKFDCGLSTLIAWFLTVGAPVYADWVWSDWKVIASIEIYVATLALLAVIMRMVAHAKWRADWTFCRW